MEESSKEAFGVLVLSHFKVSALAFTEMTENTFGQWVTELLKWHLDPELAEIMILWDEPIILNTTLPLRSCHFQMNIEEKAWDCINIKVDCNVKLIMFIGVLHIYLLIIPL